MRSAGALLALLVAIAPPALAQDDDPFGDVPDIIELRTYLDQDVYAPGSTARVAIELRIDSRVHVNSQAPVTDFQYPTSLEWESIAEGLELADVEWPKPHMMSFEFTDGEKIDVWEGTIRAFLDAEVPEGAEPGSALRVKGQFKAQGCTDTVCYAPQTDAVKFTVRIAEADEEPERINESKFAAGGEEDDEGDEPHDDESAEGPVSVGGGLGSPAEDGPELGEECANVETAEELDKPLWLIYLLAFVGGLGLTLTPCVLPLVPITIGYFSRQNQDGGRPVGLAAVYVLGLALVYSAMGTAAALTGGLFGAALQNPYVVWAIALILIGLSLSMFGLWNMQLPASMTGKMGGARAGYAGALMMGGAMGLIAAPCVGPFVVSLLTYVAKLGADPTLSTAMAALIGGSLFFVLAAGLGAPFFLVGIGVGSINPGQWMESVKKVFGFLILGVALNFLRPLLPEWVFPVGIVLLALALGVYLFLPSASAGSPKLRSPFRVLGVLAVLGGVIFGAVTLRPAADHGHLFTPYSAQALADAQTQRKPVIIDFWAEWCIACKELEKVTFANEEVRDRLEGYVLLSADLTDEEDPIVQALYKSYDIKGLPTIVLIDERGDESLDVRLTEFEPPADFLARLDCFEAIAIAAR
jgi:thiol:disulfide interchange protein DsbD